MSTLEAMGRLKSLGTQDLLSGMDGPELIDSFKDLMHNINDPFVKAKLKKVQFAVIDIPALPSWVIEEGVCSSKMFGRINRVDNPDRIKTITMDFYLSFNGLFLI